MPSPSPATTSFEQGLQDQAPPSLGRQTSSKPRLSFLDLASDIHHLILTGYLPYQFIVALRSTSSHFPSLISPPTLKRFRQNSVSNLLAAEHALF